jgi:hypothetical protein
MKSILYCTLFLIFCVPTILHAQSVATDYDKGGYLRKHFEKIESFGCHFGTQYATLYNGGKWGFGPSLGTSSVQRINEHWGLQSIWHLKMVNGQRESVTYIDHGVLPLFYGERIAKYTINRMFFIDLPIMAQYRRHSDARVKWLAGVSPSFNWLPKKRLDPIETYSTSGASFFDTPSPYEGITNRDGLKRFECGLVAGAQVSLNKRWELGIYYNQGLIDLTRDAFFTQKRGVYNSYLQMEFIYRIIVQNND